VSGGVAKFMQDHFSGRRVLITGGLGFIGSTLARRLVELGADVTVVDTLFPNYGGNMFNLGELRDRVRVNITDMRNLFSLRQMVDGVDLIFNLAGQTSHLDSMHDPTTDLEINCAAQLALLETCRHQNPDAKIVFASTRQIYGRPDYLPVDEAHPLRPTDVNGINKLAGESYHLLYGRIYGMGAVALRLTNTFGPRMRVKDARQTFLGLWIRKALEGHPFEVWGGEQLRDFTFVDDVVEAFLLAAINPALHGGAFNLSGEPVVSLRGLADMLADESGGAYEIHEFPEERKRIDIGDYYADDAEFRRLTGWAPKIPLREGLIRTLDYYRQHLTHYL
jgi:UDP-glucose 4-epimerase